MHNWAYCRDVSPKRKVGKGGYMDTDENTADSHPL